MISNLKLSKNKTVLKIVFVVIVLSLLLTGTVGYIVIGSKDYIVKINDSLITKNQFIQAVKQEKELFKKEGLEDYYYKIINNKKEKNIFYQNILNNLIGIVLLNQYAHKIGLSVSEHKIKKEIYNMDFFKKNGVFDKKKYEFFFKKYNIKENDFLKDVYENLINRQLIKIYLNNEFVLPEEYKLYADFILEKREIKMAKLFFSDYFNKQNVKENELLEYYNKNKNNFFSTEKIKIDYIKFNLNSQYKNINISDSEVETFYKNNKDYFTDKERRHYSMIQLDTKKEADSIISSLNSGVDFKYLAFKKSTDKFSATKNGSIGWFDSLSTPSEIINANLNKIGQISKLIQLGKHYIIFRLDNIKYKKVKSLKLVKKNIINILKNKKALNLFSLLKKNIKNVISQYKENDIYKISSIYNSKVISTNWFSKNNVPKGINYNKLIYSVFNSDLTIKKTNKNFLNLINLDKKNFIVFKNKDYKPKKILSFSQSKKKIFNLIKLNKTFLKMKEKSNQLILRLKNNKNKDVSKNTEIIFSKSFIVNRFLSEKKLSDIVFSMPIPKKNNPIYFTIKDNDNNLVIIKLIRIINNSLKKDKLKLFSEYYNNLFSNIIFELFISNLRENAKINFGKID